MGLTDFRKLKIWQRSMELVETVYELTEAFPKREIFTLTAQMRRAVISVPSNIAEGHIRQHTGEFRQFLFVALGSLAELETQLRIALRRKYLSQAQFENALDEILQIGKMIRGLVKTLIPNP